MCYRTLRPRKEQKVLDIVDSPQLGNGLVAVLKAIACLAAQAAGYIPHFDEDDTALVTEMQYKYGASGANAKSKSKGKAKRKGLAPS